ncbi:hypothetical protein D3C84_752720 [compost metagenome]
MSLDFVDAASGLTLPIDPHETLAVLQSPGNFPMGDPAQLIQTGFSPGQQHQFGFDQARVGQLVGFVNQYFKAHGIEQRRPGIDAVDRFPRHTENLLAQCAVLFHGLQHSPEFGRQIHPEGPIIFEVTGSGEQSDVIEKRH